MKKALAILVIALAILTIAGCSINFTAANGKLAYGSLPGKAVGDFTAKGKLVYILHPSIMVLGQKTHENLDGLIEPKIAEAGGSGATNLKITYGYDFIGFIVRYLTGIIGIDYIEVTGQIVK